jgi:3-dehydroquinate synthetase
MQRLEVKLGKRAYPILIGPGLLRSQELFAAQAEAARLLVVTDDVVGPLWMPKLEQGLAGRAFETACCRAARSRRHSATSRSSSTRWWPRGSTGMAWCSPSAAA